jgi:hypothetical protein
MLDVSFHYDLADFITAGVFFLYLSGERDTEVREYLNGRFTSFLSIYPYITRTNIFFSGGMNENFSARSFSTSGINSRGVLAPGLSAGFDITEDITIRLVSALLFAEGENPLSGERFYGWETDLNFQWNLGKHLRFLFEADVFWTGGFFDFEKPLGAQNRKYTSEPSAWKVLVGVDLFY